MYLRYGNALRARCRRLLGDPAAAEDATQEVFLRVQRHITRAPSAPEVLPWLRRIATNYCLNELRNRAVRARSSETSPADETADARHPEESIAARSEARRLFASLPQHLRDLAWLTYVDDLEQAESAKALGVSRRTVVNRMRELRARIHQVEQAPSPR
jgi:RNA polymerase sigma-70 factor (ECF subfamily)